MFTSIDGLLKDFGVDKENNTHFDIGLQKENTQWRVIIIVNDK